MDHYVGFVFYVLLLFGYLDKAKIGATTSEGSENELSTSTLQVYEEIIHFFSQNDPKGIPSVDIPDPLSIPLNYNLSSWLSISDHEVLGLSQIRLHTVIADFSQNTVHAEASIPCVNLLGQYKWSSMLWDESRGATNVTMENVDLKLDFKIIVDREGTLMMDRSNVKFLMSYRKMSVDFQNLSSGYASLAKLAFPAFIPSLVYWVEDWVHETLSWSLTSFAPSIYFPDSVPCLDFLIIQVRSCISKVGFDPLPIGSMQIDIASGISLLCGDITLRGLSTLHRVQNFKVKLIDNTLIINLQLGVQSVEMTGICGLPYILFLAGPVKVHVDSIKTTVEVHQRTHLRSPPTLRLLKIDLGTIEVKSSTIGSLDYVIDAVANVFPNLLRSNIEKQLEPLIWRILQEHLNALDLRTAVLDNLIKIEKASDQRGISY